MCIHTPLAASNLIMHAWCTCKVSYIIIRSPLIPDRLVTRFYISYLLIDGREHVKIQSHKYSDWFLTVNAKGKFRGAVPANGSELFELKTLDGADIALRSVYYTTVTSQMESETPASGSGESGSGIDPASGKMTVHCNSTQTLPNNSTQNVLSNNKQTVPNNNTQIVPSNCTETVLSKNTQNVQQQICYLGFSSHNSRPFCYNSSDYSEVRLQFWSIWISLWAHFIKLTYVYGHTSWQNTIPNWHIYFFLLSYSTTASVMLY